MNLFLICIKIFFARILDVSIGTIRANVMLHDKKMVAAVLAFLETLLWLSLIHI